MADLNDRNTDALFQAGAERHEFAYNPEAWALMEAKLDEQEAAAAASPTWRRYLPLLLLGLVLLGGFGYYFLGNENLEVEETLAKGAQSSESTQAMASEAGVSGSDLEVLTLGGTSPVAQQPELNEITEASKSAPKGTNSSQPRVSTSGPKSTAQDQAHIDEMLSPVSVSSVEVFNSEEGGSDVIADAGRVNEANPSGDQTVVESATEASTVASLLPSAQLPLLEVPSRSIPTPSVAIYEESDEFRPTVKDRWALSLNAGLITGRSKGVDLPRAQPRFGLLADYRIGDKLTLSTGALYSMVHYRIEGDRYEAKPGFFIDDVQPIEVKAACSIVEVPLHATYYFSGSRGSSFFAGAGAVSYLLLKENYKYDYAEENAALKKEWEESNANQHPFGLGQVNFGYQRQLPGRGAVQLETYAHLPLTGLGHGNVRLTSFGVSLKYQFSFGRR